MSCHLYHYSHSSICFKIAQGERLLYLLFTLLFWGLEHLIIFAHNQIWCSSCGISIFGYYKCSLHYMFLSYYIIIILDSLVTWGALAMLQTVVLYHLSWGSDIYQSAAMSSCCLNADSAVHLAIHFPDVHVLVATASGFCCIVMKNWY